MRITIEMDLETAQVLYTVTQKIGGHPTGPRGNIDVIREALRDAGVGESKAAQEAADLAARKYAGGVGSIIFEVPDPLREKPYARASKS